MMVIQIMEKTYQHLVITVEPSPPTHFHSIPNVFKTEMEENIKMKEREIFIFKTNLRFKLNR